ncbi:MAG: TaqI-like C-terminal specificity domain-containing protein [Candidatus Ratteibacteria bacterium]
MKKQILQDIINNFDEKKFIRFFREANDKFCHPCEPLYHEDDTFKQGNKLEEINFEDGNLIVCLLPVKKSLTERTGKKAQYELGKKILRENQTDAGIFIFYDGNANFRFSLIYANYLGKRRDWSSFRRFTYFVSPELTNKTFLQRIGKGNFSSLESIKEAFSVEKVTKEFYQDISYWYFWAVQHSRFPKDAEAEDNGRNVAVIRLITRMIFIWFMREKGLIPKELFEKESINGILRSVDSDDSTYYKAILQNLFFATLNTKKDERQFRSEIRGYKGYNPDFGNQYVYRYHNLFTDSKQMEEYFGNIPFLNGGLFDCLDDGEKDIYIDGFTERKKKYQPNVPNFLFFSDKQKIDLNEDFGTINQTYEVTGLLKILFSFNFTIDENSPDDADIALDPELLGRVFENLLASFNPETSTTARQATGSYYTPREIVDYMVTESLKAYFKTHLSEITDIDGKLVTLFSQEKEVNPFNEAESKILTQLIENVKIVDPAVGSGAFPMGALNKMVFILNKIDPDNELWKEAQLTAANKMPDPKVKEITKKQIEEFFKDKNADYGRKLYLIQKCIYGVDIQQVAVEIAKLRFFISLLVDEKIDETKENWGIEPLPNLDFKIMQGNSLISEFLGIDFDKTNGELQQHLGLGFEPTENKLIKEFEQKKSEFQNEYDRRKKKELKTQVEDLMVQIFETILQKKYAELKQIEEKAKGFQDPKIKEEYIKNEKTIVARKHGINFENIEKQLREFTSKNKIRPFFSWKLYFAEIFKNGGFDVVIGNPPYFSIDPKQKKISRQFYLYLQKNYKSFHGLTDILVFFFEKSFDLLKKNGILTFISKNRWHNSPSYKNFCNYLTDKNTFILDFDEIFIFNGIGVTTNIILVKKGKEAKINYRLFDNSSLKNIFDHAHYKKYHLVPIIGKPWNIMTDRIVDKIKNKGSYILQGGYGHKITPGKYFKLIKVEANVFVPEDYKIKKKTGKIMLTNKEMNYVFPFASSGDIFPYFIASRDRFILNLLKADLEDLPNIKEYFSKIKEVVNQNRWYEYHGGRGYRNVDIISEPKKIIFPARMYLNRKSSFFLDEKTILIGMDCGALVSKNQDLDLRFILAILNSSTIWYYIRKMFKRYTKRQTVKIDKLPIPEVSYNQKPFIDLVNKILSITKTDDYLNNPDKQAQVKEYEKEIDQLVYKLYGLTPEEINIVEGN